MSSGAVLRVVEPASPHGIYVYSPEKRGWVQASKRDLAGDGIYAIYFSNSGCGACRLFDDIWYPAVEKLAPRASARFVVVLCEYFANSCESEDASSLFKEFDVHVSPTIVLVKRSNSRIVKLLKHEGLISSVAFVTAYVNTLVEGPAAKSEKG